LFLYGSPGVGKTELAKKLAEELRASYPDGQLYVTGGVAGGRRTPRDILRVFMKELGLPEAELREAVQLGNAFRAATANRRMLVVLDAARDKRQIQAILPGGDSSTVIVTSRANLAEKNQDAWRVDRPSPAEAARILRAYLATGTHVPDGTDASSPELIAEAAELCGRQPIALRAIGERVRDARGSVKLRDIVSTLQNPETRLQRLAYGGRDAGERIATEYAQLSRKSQSALQLLTLVKASSFTPWVLQPLLQTSLPECVKLMAALSEVGLLEESPTDPTDFPRYGFSPLVRLFAEREAASARAADEAPFTQAQKNLRAGLLRRAQQVAAELDPAVDLGAPPDMAPDWEPDVEDWRQRVAQEAPFWVRAEFPNVVEAAREAHDYGLQKLTWKLCAQLTECDVVHPCNDDLRDAFEKARDAARAGSEGDPGAFALVLLAEGCCLLAGEHYTDGIATLTDAFEEAQRLGDHLLEARVSRLIAQAEQRLGDYTTAAYRLRSAQDTLRRAAPDKSRTGGLSEEGTLIAALLTENDFHVNPEHWARNSSSDTDAPSSASFTEHLVAARIARHRNDLPACQAALRKAAEAINGDEQLAFQLRLERIACALEGRLTAAQQQDAIAEAAHLVVAAAAVGATTTSAEARILLAEGLLASGDARQCIGTLAPLDAAEPARYWPRLHARRMRLQAEARLLSGDLAGAEFSARSAVEQSMEMRDYWAQADSQLLLGRIQIARKRQSAARVSLLMALEGFDLCGDHRNADRALALLAAPSVLLACRTIASWLKWRLLRRPTWPPTKRPAAPTRSRR
jgi:hypothetical protein